MGREAKSGKAQKPKRSKAPRGSSAGLIPSRTWVQGARALWGGLPLSERGLLVLGVFVPALDQVSRLGSLGVMIRAVGYGIRKPLDLEMRLWLGLIILGATLVSVFVQMCSERVKNGLKAQNTRMARRMYGVMMAEAARLPSEERKEQVQHLLGEEKGFLGSATSGLSATIGFLSEVFLVLVLLAILAWFDWIVGAILLVAGVAMLMVLRCRVKASPQREGDKENEKLVEARKAATQKLESIGSRRASAGELIEEYADNEFDRLAGAEAEDRTRLQRKISSAMNFGSAVLMALVFLLVSAEGAFDENKIVWMVVFVFGLRMAVSHGKMAMRKWGAILAEKHSLMQLAKAGLVSQSRCQEEDCGEEDPEPEAEVEAGNGYGTLAHIVEYSFRGLNGPEIVSREPLVVEMCVEAREAIEGVSWSFAISNLDGTSFLITKTTADHGIIWDIPKGKSWFRVVTGPVWLPAGTFSGWIGIAKGSQTLDLIGSQAEPELLHVLPDEAVKRMVPIREIHDVVAMDVEWDREFRKETSESWETRKTESEHFLAN